MKKINKTLIGILICGILLSITMLAASNSKMIEAFYTGIKLYVDGAEYVPTDANGKVVEPFIYNGTTYLPVRAVANAFGKDVIWDGKTQSVYLGKKDQNQPDAYLHDLMYTDYREGVKAHGLNIINGTITDLNGKAYTNGLLFWLDDTWSGEERWCEVDYALNCQYDTLVGTVVLPKSYSLNIGSGTSKPSETNILFTDADTGEVLFKVSGATPTLPYKFEVDVTGVNKLIVHVYNEDGGHIALTGLALYE